MKKVIITERTSVEVELEHEACATCKYVKSYIRQQQKRQHSANSERYGTLYRTKHGQIQQKSDRIRMVITLPREMKGKSSIFDSEASELVDMLYSAIEIG